MSETRHATLFSSSRRFIQAPWRRTIPAREYATSTLPRDPVFEEKMSAEKFRRFFFFFSARRFQTLFENFKMEIYWIRIC